jgi:hypothetical protein
MRNFQPDYFYLTKVASEKNNVAPSPRPEQKIVLVHIDYLNDNNIKKISRTPDLFFNNLQYAHKRLLRQYVRMFILVVLIVLGCHLPR